MQVRGSGNGVIITKQYKEAGLGEKGVGEVSPKSC